MPLTIRFEIFWQSVAARALKPATCILVQTKGGRKVIVVTFGMEIPKRHK